MSSSRSLNTIDPSKPIVDRGAAEGTPLRGRQAARTGTGAFLSIRRRQDLCALG